MYKILKLYFYVNILLKIIIIIMYNIENYCFVVVVKIVYVTVCYNFMVKSYKQQKIETFDKCILK